MAPPSMWDDRLKLRPGQTLRLGPTRSGARCYLCVQGGIAVTPFLGSASTHILSGLGGFEGRAAAQRRCTAHRVRDQNLSARERSLRRHRSICRLAKSCASLPGPQADWFPESSLRSFYESTYRVGEQSNRMGLRLEGAPVTASGAGQMITEGVSLGAIQVPAGGSPIILFVEQQTTGGYPKIANVISADLHRVGQLRPRDEIRFEQVTFEAARSLLMEQEQLLASRESILE